MFWSKPKFAINTLPPGTKPAATVAEPVAAPVPGQKAHAEFTVVKTVRPEPKRVAYIVVHGMGQQVEYQTLGQLGDLMVDEERKLGTYSAPTGVKVVRVKITNDPNDVPLSRAEFTVQRGKEQIDVHVYEGYWAPLTEGKITFLETISFLFSAAFNGLVSSVRGSAFKRWMFGDFQDLPIKMGTFYSLFTLLIGLCAVLSPLGLAYYYWQEYQAGKFHWMIISGHPIFSAALLAALAFYCWAIYYVTVEYAGDVAIYVSSYKVSKFEKTRAKIQDAVFNVVRQVYSAKAGGGQPGFLYDKVVFVGHSLGSVIAYDMLNAAISWDLAENANSMRVVERTSALITFGSPLDKTAFLFRTQVSGPQFLREALAAQRQPLILNYEEFRPRESFHWTNIYSRADIVSGCLQYYDTPEKPAADATPEPFRNPVKNVIDWAAWVPVLAHVMYWNDQKLRDELYGAIR
jgi:hypothetical protein